jgi:hypothetical protein
MAGSAAAMILAGYCGGRPIPKFGGKVLNPYSSSCAGDMTAGSTVTRVCQVVGESRV